MLRFTLPLSQPSLLMTRSNLATRARYTLAISVVATLLLYNIPQLHTLAYPLLLISTLVHELGHGVAAMLAGGTFERFVMHQDGSGVAHTRGVMSDMGRAFVAAGGLVGPAVAAAMCFASARRARTARYAMGAMGFLLLVALALVVRNGFGILFVAIFAGACLLIAYKAGPQLVQLGLVFLAVQLALSVYARGDYLFTKSARTANGVYPSDAQNIAEAMGFAPYWFWGGVCGAFSVIVLLMGSLYFLRGSRR